MGTFSADDQNRMTCALKYSESTLKQNQIQTYSGMNLTSQISQQTNFIIQHPRISNPQQDQLQQIRSEQAVQGSDLEEEEAGGKRFSITLQQQQFFNNPSPLINKRKVQRQELSIMQEQGSSENIEDQQEKVTPKPNPILQRDYKAQNERKTKIQTFALIILILMHLVQLMKLQQNSNSGNINNMFSQYFEDKRVFPLMNIIQQWSEPLGVWWNFISLALVILAYVTRNSNQQSPTTFKDKEQPKAKLSIIPYSNKDEGTPLGSPESKHQKKSIGRLSRQENILRIDTLLDNDINNPPSPQQKDSPQPQPNTHPAILLQVEDEDVNRKDSSVTQISQIRQTLQLPVAKKHTSTKMVLSSQYSSNTTYLAQNRFKYNQSRFNPKNQQQSQQQVFQFSKLLANQEKNSSKEISLNGSLSKAAQLLKQRFINSHYKAAQNGKIVVYPTMAFKLLRRATISGKHQQLLISDYDKSQNSEFSVSRDESMLKITDSVQHAHTDQNNVFFNGIGSTSSPNRGAGLSNNLQTGEDSSKSLLFQVQKKNSNPKGSLMSSQLALSKPVTTSKIFRVNSSLGPGGNTSGSQMQNMQTQRKGGAYNNKNGGRNGHATQMVIQNKDAMSASQNYGYNVNELYRKKIKKLEKQLNNTKIFLNMVIHDMRNPTNSIEFAIKQIIQIFNQSTNANQAAPELQSRFKKSEQQLLQLTNTDRHSLYNSQLPQSSQQNLNQNRLLLGQNSCQQMQQFQPFTAISRQQTPTSPLNVQQQIQILHEVSERQHEDEEEDLKGENDDGVENSIDNNQSPKYSYARLNQSHQENNSEDESLFSNGIKPYSFKVKRMLYQEIREEESESSCNVMAIERVLSYESMNVAEEEYQPVVQHVVVTDTKENGINIAITEINDDSSISVFRKFVDNEGEQVDDDSPNITTDILNHKTNFESGTFLTDARDNASRVRNEFQDIRVQGNIPSLIQEGEEEQKISQITSNNQGQTGTFHQINQNNNVQGQSSIQAQYPNQSFQQYLTVENCKRSKTKGRDNMQRRDGVAQNNYFFPSDKDSGMRHATIKELHLHQENRISMNLQTVKQISDQNNQTHAYLDRSGATNEEIKNDGGPQTLSLKLQKSSIQNDEYTSLNQRRLFINTQNLPAQKKPSLKSPISISAKGHIMGAHSSYNRNNSLGSNQTSQVNQKSANSSERKKQSGAFLKLPIPSSAQFSNQFVLQIPQNVVLLNQEEKNKCESMLKNTLFSSSMLLNLINDLLDLAKIEKGQFNLNTTNFNLHEIIQKAIDTLGYLSSQKNIKMEYQYEENQVGFFISLTGDDNRYLQILLNFLSNALKFTPNGGNIKVVLKLIENQTKSNDGKANIVGKNQFNNLPTSQQNALKMPLKYRKNSVFCPSGDQESSNLLVRRNLSQENLNFTKKTSITTNLKSLKKNQDKQIEHIDVNELKQTVEDALKHYNKPVEKYIKFEIRIIDSGYGISKENIPKLFMNFGKLAEHADQNKQGTGLGLSICKSLIELMGGTVTVESELNKGTEFIISMQTKCQYPPQSQINKWLDKAQGVVYKDQQSDGNLNRLNFNNLTIMSNQQQRVPSRDSSSKQPTFKQSQVVQDYNNPLSLFTPVFNKYDEPKKISKMSNSNLLSIPQSKNDHSNSGRKIPNIYVELAPESEEQIQNPFIDQSMNFKIETFAHSISSQPLNIGQLANLANNQYSNHQKSKLLPNISSDVYLLNSFEGIGLPQQQNIFNECVQEQPEPAQYRALVANDDPFQLQIITMMLGNFGFELDLAENGLEAVQKYSESIGKPYDLIILDLDMPIMNGYEACQKIRRVGVHESIKELLRIETKKKIGGLDQKKKATDNDIIEERNKEKVYIVALSGLITDNVIEKGSKCGFDDFIETPLTDAKIREIIISRLQTPDQNLQSEDSSSSSDEELQNENPRKSSNNHLNRFLSVSKHVLERNGTHLINQAFSAVDEEQSNMQDDAQSSIQMNNVLMEDESEHRYLNKKYMM